MTTPPTSRSARIMSLFGVSQVLRVDRAVVNKWIKSGAPLVREGGLGRGNEWQLDLADLWVWWGEHNRKLALAEAGVGKEVEPKDKLILLKIAKEGGLVAPVSVVEDVIARVLSECRQSMVAMDASLSDVDARKASWKKDDGDAWASARAALVDLDEWRKLSRPFALPKGGSINLFGGALLVCARAKKPGTGMARKLLACVTLDLPAAIPG